MPADVNRRRVVAKVRAVNEALAVAQPVPALAECARAPMGFVNDGLRRRAWAQAMDVDYATLRDFRADIREHRYTGQVKLDVDRSHSHFERLRKRDGARRRGELEAIVQAVLSRNPELHYYQGFHDVCAVLLNVLVDDKLAFAVAERVAQRLLRSAMHESLEPVLQQLALILALLWEVDRELFAMLRQAEVPVYFALSWQITWFAHDVDDGAARARLFDLFIVSPQELPIYLVLSAHDELLALGPSDPDVLHHTLSKLAHRERIDWDTLVARATQLFTQHPPSRLRTSKAPVSETWSLRQTGAVRKNTPPAVLARLRASQPALLRLAFTVVAVSVSYYVASNLGLVT